ncbi:MAG: hypothetical protein N4A49_16275 [Marinifilaceae bacterium]|nr:hypothetical protein [Marinifilaceae bacterium]
MKNLILLLVSVVILGLTSCDKDKEIKGEGVLSFAFQNSNSKQTKSALTEENEIVKAVITIKKNGSVYKDYTLKEIKVNKWNSDNYSTEEITLEEGTKYELTHFSLKNKNGETLFATPAKNSKKASSVNNPLNIEFSVKAGQVSRLDIEVVSAINTTPSDFGYVFFNIKFPKIGNNLVRMEKKRANEDKPYEVYEYFYKENGEIDYYLLNKKDKYTCNYSSGKLIEEYLNKDFRNVYVYDKEAKKVRYIKGQTSTGHFNEKHIYDYIDGELKLDVLQNSQEKDISRTYYTKVFWRDNSDYKVEYLIDSEGKAVLNAFITYTQDAKGRIIKETKSLNSTNEIVSEISYIYSDSE